MQRYPQKKIIWFLGLYHPPFLIIPILHLYQPRMALIHNRPSFFYVLQKTLTNIQNQFNQNTQNKTKQNLTQINIQKQNQFKPKYLYQNQI